MDILIGEAIILDSVKHREAGSRLLISTNNNGHLSVVAPNSKRSKRRFIGGLNIFSRIEYMVEHKNDLMVLGESTLIDEYEATFVNKDAFITASVLCEIAMRLYSMNNPSETAFLPLKHSFEHIKGDLDLDCIFGFLKRSMISVGEFVEFDSCVVCQSAIDRRALLFNYYKGGILCRCCARLDPRGEYISREIFEFFLSDNNKQASCANGIKRQAIFLLERYLQFKLNIKFVSFKFI